MTRKVKKVALQVADWMLSGSGAPSEDARKSVSAWLAERPTLDAQRWFESHWQRAGVSREVADYVYEVFGKLSGIEFGRVLPMDRMYSDLSFNETSGGDWDFEHSEQFAKRFGVPSRVVAKGHPRIKDDPHLLEIVLHLERIVRKGRSAKSHKEASASRGSTTRGSN